MHAVRDDGYWVTCATRMMALVTARVLRGIAINKWIIKKEVGL